jgi:hypothetical protein
MLLAGCGYIGPPQSPALEMPQRVSDLTVAQRGDKSLAQFTIPPLTTEGVVLKSVRSVDLRVGVAPNPWNADVWAAGAKQFDVSATGPGMLKKEIPAREWIGKDVTIMVRATGPKGKTSDWSNPRTLPIQPPLETPSDLKAENTPQGIAITWRGGGPQYHIFRSVADAPPELLADAARTVWLDSPVEYGTRYIYYVQAFTGELQQSDVAGPAEVTPEDIFPPSAPSGLTAELGTNTVELSWERNTDPRFQGYNVYRSTEGGPFVKIASAITPPTYSDHDVQAGKKYQYAISAVATNGKESDRSAVFEITAQ